MFCKWLQNKRSHLTLLKSCKVEINKDRSGNYVFAEKKKEVVRMVRRK